MTCQAEGNGFKDFSPAPGQTGTVADEEGAVRSQFICIAFEAGGIEAAVKKPVQGKQGEGSIGRASSQSRANGDLLMEMDPYRKRSLAVPEQPGRSEAEILTAVGNFQSADRDSRSRVIKSRIAGEYLEHIAQADRIEYGFEIMETIAAPAQDPQADVDLCIREDDHAFVKKSASPEDVKHLQTRTVKVSIIRINC